MTWKILNESEVVIFEKRESGPCFMFTSAGPEGVLWFRSPCGVPVATQGHCLEHALGILHANGFRTAVLEILSSVDLYVLDDFCMADFCAGYGVFGGMAVMAEQSRASCHYLLELKEVSNEKTNGYIRQAQDMARSALAKHAANDALKEMGVS